VKSWPSVDLLLNNAGVYHQGTKAEDFLDSFHVNTVIPFLLTQALLTALKKSAHAKVASISSLMGSIEDNSSGGSYAYRSSKTALNMINKGLAVDNPWLTAVVLHPGWVETDMGGKGAPVKIPDSAQGLWKVIDALTKEQTGSFIDFRGRKLHW
jgi:NAD(P)-dependent dehydrogenase (short-subunit alcohol dehydrogenase family)